MPHKWLGERNGQVYDGVSWIRAYRDSLAIGDPDKVLDTGLERWQGSVLFIGGAVDHHQTLAACGVAIGSKAPECFGVMGAKGIQHSEFFLRNSLGERRPLIDSHHKCQISFLGETNGHWPEKARVERRGSDRFTTDRALRKAFRVCRYDDSFARDFASMLAGNNPPDLSGRLCNRHLGHALSFHKPIVGHERHREAHEP
jgi:hypothetical protein